MIEMKQFYDYFPFANSTISNPTQTEEPELNPAPQ